MHQYQRTSTPRGRAPAAALAVAAALVGGLMLYVVFSHAAPRGDVRPPPRGTATPAQTVWTLDGRVRCDGRPLAGARVGVKGAVGRVTSAADGSFRLTLDRPGPLRLAAAAAGCFIGGTEWQATAAGAQPPLSIELRRCPTDDHADYAWTDPRPSDADAERCANCHRAIFDEWTASAHGQAAVNRRFMNLYDGSDWDGNESIGWNLRAEYPEGAGVCASCHVPSLPLDPRATADLRTVGGVDRQGVHCDFCHKVVDVAVDRVGLDHGPFAMRFCRPPPGQRVFFGAMDDDDRGHSVYEPIYRDSRLCASCHEGIVFGRHEYSDYSEWQATAYAARGVQCQDCHMRPSEKLHNIAPGRGGIDRDPRTLASHRSTRATPAALRACLKLDLTATRTAAGIEAVATLRVEGVGHRFPAGHPGRQLLLWVEAADAAGRPLPLRTGPTLPPLAGAGRSAEGGLAGRPGRLYAKVFESPAGRQPVADWAVANLAYDSRLAADAVEHQRFVFAAGNGPATVTARLIFRRFPWALARQKHWPENDVPVVERTVVPTGK